VRARFRQNSALCSLLPASIVSPDNTYINYEFIPDPTGHAYGIGFGKLLGDITETINTTINQILDAGNLQNAGGGFIGREFRLKSGTLKQEIGLWKQVPFSGDDIRKSMVKFDHPGPSPVLFQMLGLLQEWTKKITSTSEVLAGEATPNQPATTTLALIEQGLKVFTGIIGRMLRALGEELRAYFDLNARFADQEQTRYAMLGDTPAYISRQDFNPDSCDVVPVADSTVVTDAQAMARAEMIMQVAATPIGQNLMDPAGSAAALSPSRPHSGRGSDQGARPAAAADPAAAGHAPASRAAGQGRADARAGYRCLG
jgi:chaperonin GroES